MQNSSNKVVHTLWIHSIIKSNSSTISVNFESCSHNENDDHIINTNTIILWFLLIKTKISAKKSLIVNNIALIVFIVLILFRSPFFNVYLI